MTTTPATTPTTVGTEPPKLPATPQTLTLPPELLARVDAHFNHCPFCGGKLSHNTYSVSLVKCDQCGTDVSPIIRKLVTPDLPIDENSSFGFDLKMLGLELDHLVLEKVGKPRATANAWWPVRDAVFHLKQLRTKLDVTEKAKSIAQSMLEEMRSKQPIPGHPPEVRPPERFGGAKGMVDTAIEKSVAECSGKFSDMAKARWSGSLFCRAPQTMHPMWAVLIGAGIACLAFAIAHAIWFQK